jgi:hypothetical protein
MESSNANPSNLPEKQLPNQFPEESLTVYKRAQMGEAVTPAEHLWLRSLNEEQQGFLFDQIKDAEPSFNSAHDPSKFPDPKRPGPKDEENVVKGPPHAPRQHRYPNSRAQLDHKNPGTYIYDPNAPLIDHIHEGSTAATRAAKDFAVFIKGQDLRIDHHMRDYQRQQYLKQENSRQIQGMTYDPTERRIIAKDMYTGDTLTFKITSDGENVELENLEGRGRDSFINERKSKIHASPVDSPNTEVADRVNVSAKQPNVIVIDYAYNEGHPLRLPLHDFSATLDNTSLVARGLWESNQDTLNTISEEPEELDETRSVVDLSGSNPTNAQLNDKSRS